MQPRWTLRRKRARNVRRPVRPSVLALDGGTAYNEGELVIGVLDRLFESVRLPCEVLVVVDSADDTTVPVTEEYAQKEPQLRCLVNTYGRGPANAIRFGEQHKGQRSLILMEQVLVSGARGLSRRVPRRGAAETRLRDG